MHACDLSEDQLAILRLKAHEAALASDQEYAALCCKFEFEDRMRLRKIRRSSAEFQARLAARAQVKRLREIWTAILAVDFWRDHATGFNQLPYEVRLRVGRGRVAS